MRMHLPMIGLVLALVTLTNSIHADPIPKKKDKTTEDKLLGKWNLVKQNGTEVNDVWIKYLKDGKLELHYGQGMGNVTYLGKYKIEKEQIEHEIDMMGQIVTEKVKILSIVDDKLKTEDPDGVVEEFEKVVEKKP